MHREVNLYLGTKQYKIPGMYVYKKNCSSVQLSGGRKSGHMYGYSKRISTHTLVQLLRVK